jgi:hypothetical protein
MRCRTAGEDRSDTGTGRSSDCCSRAELAACEEAQVFAAPARTGDLDALLR